MLTPFDALGLLATVITSDRVSPSVTTFLVVSYMAVLVVMTSMKGLLLSCVDDATLEVCVVSS